MLLFKWAIVNPVAKPKSLLLPASLSRGRKSCGNRVFPNARYTISGVLSELISAEALRTEIILE